MERKQKKVGIVGAGAAGMMAAITAAREGADVTLLEGGERVGKKILVTGNGKCNLGNWDLSAEEYHGADREWLQACLARFDTEETIRFFHGIGLLVKEKKGYLYPLAEQASVVLDALRAELNALGVKLITSCKVDDVSQEAEGGFQVKAGGRNFHFDRVVLACGGKAAPKTGSDGSGYKLAKGLGHDIVPVVPALVQLKCREEYLKEVSGVRTEAEITVLPETCAEGERLRTGCMSEDEKGRNASGGGSSRWQERGELQLTDHGISGIPVFQLSRLVNYRLKPLGKQTEVEVKIDLLPEFDEKSLRGLYEIRRLLLTERTVEEFFNGLLNKKLMYLFIKLAGLKRNLPIAEAEESKIEKVFALCKDWRLHVTGSNSYENAQVCAGGVDTAQVGENMESQLVPGLYFAGEILDVDGRCGGYNLQWAWCSGYLAGRAAAE